MMRPLGAPARGVLQCCLAVLGGVLAAGIVRLPVQAAPDAPGMPPGFALRPLVESLLQPVDLEILPSGELFIAEKGSGGSSDAVARVLWVRSTGIASPPVLELPVNAQGDTGILGLLIAPDFAETGHFYLWYATGPSSLGWSGETSMRLSRFTFDHATGAAALASEAIILDGVTWAPIHNGGGLGWDAAGNLLLATGDTAAPLDPAKNWAQNPSSLNGKVLRITPLPNGGYSTPADNPFVGVDGYRPEIYAMGLRNPYRMTYRPEDGEFYLIDVGLDQWEEINRLAPGANYGWPVREGPCALAQSPDRCTPNTGSEYVEPLVTYPHGEMGAGIAALAFYDGDRWPQPYRHQVYFADYNSLWVARQAITATAPSTLTTVITDAGVIVDMEATGAGLYLLDFVDGAVKQLYVVDAANQPPVPHLTATPAMGPGPLTVHLSASGSYDPDDLTLHYEWDLGLGAEVIRTAQPEIEAVYADDGAYEVSLRVADGRGGVSPALEQVITVYSGALPAIVADNLTEPGRTQFYGGDHWRFSAERDGDGSDLDPGLPYRWDLLLAHNEHVHPELSNIMGATLHYTTPTESHGAGAIFYIVRLTMQTATGLSIPVTQTLQPKQVSVQLATWPPGGTVTLNGQALTSGNGRAVMAGHVYELSAPPSRRLGAEVWAFDSWHVTDQTPTDSPPAGETISERNAEVTMPAASATYVAVYRYDRPAGRLHLPSVRGE